MQHQPALKPSRTAHCCQSGKPVAHSHQLLNHIVDCRATHKPQALFAEYPVSATSYDEGFLKITYAKLANAIDRIAWWLVETLGHGQGHPTIAYIGPNDLVYPSLILGAIKAGYKTLLLSPRNSIEAQLHLLQATKCKIFLRPEPCPPPIASLLQHLDESYHIYTVPTVEDLLQTQCESFVYDVSLEEGRGSPFAVMHTSGSTGLPKPIEWPQSFTQAYAKQLQLTPPCGFDSTDQLYEGNRVFVIFPPFHAAYIAHVLVNAITNQTAVILPLRGSIPSAHSLNQIAKATKIDVALVVPLVIEEMSRVPELLDEIASRIDIMVYCGGDVPQGCGDIVAACMPLVNFYGSTEGTSLALVHTEGALSRQNWKFLSFHPSAGAEFRHHADDMHELYILRRPELEVHQQIFQTFPDLQEYRTRDLFRRHLTKSHLWSHCGRADDTIVFITGEKLAPVDAEQYIFAENPEISGVLIAGSQRFQPALLIECVQRDLQFTDIELLTRIWPSIERANRLLPTHAQITKSHVLFVDPRRPMSRSPKGTIQRAATMIEYADHLDALYESAGELDTTASTLQKIDWQDIKSINQYLGATITKLTGLNLGENDNFFLQGIDSLQSLVLLHDIKRQNVSFQKLGINVIYAQPTIASLGLKIQQTVKYGMYTEPGHTQPRVNEILTIKARYFDMIDQIPQSQPVILDGSASPVYLLTGSTGSVGSYILDSLLKSTAAHIYCLNRSENSMVSQHRNNTMRGLSTYLPSSRVTFLTANLSHSSFGLNAETYARLSESVTHVIHGAWSVNFNLPLSSFETQLQGVVELLRFSQSALQRPSMLYISSISAVSSLVCESVPETIVDDVQAPMPTGYGVSKYVAEHLLDYATRRLKLDVRIARVGQIAGPVARPGSWNSSEWLPSLIISSANIGAIPGSLGKRLDRIDWMPVDQLAEALIELIMNDKTGCPGDGAKFYNFVNPSTTQWIDLLPSIKRTILAILGRKGSAGTDICIVTFEDWIEKVQNQLDMDLELRKSSDDQSRSVETVLAANPAAKLLDFYRDASTDELITWDTAQARLASSLLNSIGSVRSEWMELWIAGWF